MAVPCDSLFRTPKVDIPLIQEEYTVSNYIPNEQVEKCVLTCLKKNPPWVKQSQFTVNHRFYRRLSKKTSHSFKDILKNNQNPKATILVR